MRTAKQENDVVEGIVLMRKYEKSLPVSEAVEEEDRGDPGAEAPSPGDEDQDLQPAHRAGPRDDAQRAAQPARGHGPGHRHPLHLPGRPGQRGDRGDHDPAGLLFSITVLYVQGKSANLLSIGAVDFGIIVDSSTIIVENIYRHITAPGADRSRPLIDRIIDASSEIERALFFSTTIIVCAFIPLFSMTGPEGALFGPMANTYAFAICGALLMAVTLAPVLCSFFFVNKKEAPTHSSTGS